MTIQQGISPNCQGWNKNQMQYYVIVKTCIGEIEDDAFETSIYII